MKKLYFRKFFHWQLFLILFVFGFLALAYSQTKDDADNKNNEALFCANDSDCTTTYYPSDSCCEQCKIFPINTISFEQQVNIRSKECSSAVCPEYRCLWRVKEVKCINKKCNFVDDKIDY